MKKLLLLILMFLSVSTNLSAKENSHDKCVNDLIKTGNIVGSKRALLLVDRLCNEFINNELEITKVKEICELKYYSQLTMRRN